MRRKGAFILLVAGAAAGAWLAWRAAGARTRIESGACRGCNVLLITIDTLRRDRVHAFGGVEGLTPNLDRLAADGFRVTRAYAPAPLTLPSHASMLTGTAPPVHGLRANGLFRLNQNRSTLASVLKAAGYRTGAFVGAFVLDARFGLGKGFDVYDDRYGEKRAGDAAENAERRAEEVIRPALGWILGAAPGPAPGTPAPGTSTQHAAPSTQHPSWLAWLHLYDPHEPYRAPEPYASAHAPYDAEIAYVDAQVGRLLDELRARGALDNTLVVIAADHGESLGEHGERTHGVFVYDATMRVPWIIWAGGSVRGSSDALVGLVDLAPTILDLVGVPRPGEFQGRSIVPRIHDGGAGPVYIEAMDANLTRNWAPLTGLVSGGYKLIDLPIAELYDLAADPDETANLFVRDPVRARALGRLLQTTTGGFEGSDAQKTTLSEESRQRLQALGYVASATERTGRVYSDADDPKTLIGPANDLQRALAAFEEGSREQGIAAVRDIMRAHPSFTTAFGVFASMQRETGNLPGAIATLEDLVRRGIADQSVMVVLAGYLQETGAFDRSAGLLRAVIADHPDYADAHNSIGVVYSRMGRHAEAQAAFRRVLELDPTSAKTYENIGVDELAAGDLDAAAKDLARALALAPDLAGAHNALAAVHRRQGRTPEAIAEWKKAVDLDPALFDALYNLAVTLHDAGRRDEARPYLERFVREAPPSRYGADIARMSQLLGR